MSDPVTDDDLDEAAHRLATRLNRLLISLPDDDPAGMSRTEQKRIRRLQENQYE